MSESKVDGVSSIERGTTRSKEGIEGVRWVRALVGWEVGIGSRSSAPVECRRELANVVNIITNSSSTLLVVCVVGSDFSNCLPPSLFPPVVKIPGQCKSFQ
jgi:hypothetical protein